MPLVATQPQRRKIGGANFGPAQLRTIVRCRVPISLTVPWHLRLVGKRRQGRLGREQRVQRKMSPRPGAASVYWQKGSTPASGSQFCCELFVPYTA